MASHHQHLRQALTRSVAEECGGPRAVRYSATTYSAFQIGEKGRTYEIEGIDASSLDEAMSQAVGLRALSHKQHLLVREHGEGGTKLHVFAVKQRSAPRYEHRNHVTRAVRDLYLSPICTIDAGVVGL